MTAVLCIILFSYLFLPIVSSNVVNVTENDNPSWLKMGYTEKDFSMSVVVSDGTMTVGTQTGEATEMILFACDTGMLMYTDNGFRLIYQSAGNTVIRDSDATGVAVSSSNKTVTVIMGGMTYSMQMNWAYYPNEEGGYAYFPTDSYNFKQGDPVAVYGDFAGIYAYNDMMSQGIGLDFKADVSEKHLNNMRWGKLAEGETAVDITTITGTAESETESTVTNIVTGHTFTAMSVMNAGNSTTYTDGNWQYILDGTDAIITAYTGAGVDTLTIPATVGGYSVKQVGNGTAVLSNYVYNLVFSNGIESIGDYAFQNSDIYDSISFPSSLKSIGDYAFAGCECEGSLNMGGTQLVTIGEHAFDQCDKFNGTLTLPSLLTTIGDYAFQSCWRLTGALIIPASVTSIGNHAFGICQGFTSLTLNTWVQTIGESAFENCDSMTGTLTIPASVTSIGDYAFGDCDFDKVIFNSQSPNVGSHAFEFDPYGEKDTIVTVVNNSVLDLSNPNYGLHNAVFEVNGWQYKIIWELSGGEYTSKYAIVIHHDPFTNVSVTIPSSVASGTVTYDVKQVGDGESAIATISNCTLTIPNSIERINDNAFMNTGLTGTLTLPDSVTAIGNSAFSGCSGLAGTLTLLSTVTEIGSEAFKGCSDLINLVILSNPTVGTDAFANTGIKQVLNLGTTEFTKTSYGLNADEVRTDIQADGCIAISHEVQEKTDIVSTLMKILPLLILMVILVLIARPLFGMDEDDDDESGSGSDDYEYY